MEMIGTCYKLTGTGAILRGADGGRYFLPFTEILAHRPHVGDRFRFDVQTTDRGPLAVGAKFLEAGVRV